MLRDLIIDDILLIEHLELEFHSGLNVLTGETGAGKSILLDCLGFVLGWRGRAEVVRRGAEKGEVTAIFDVDENHPAQTVLEEAGFEATDELILRRIATQDGRKRAFVNDKRASGEVLRALSNTLVELHGQQDDRGLLNPRAHRQLLDAFAGLEAQIETSRTLWRTWRQAETARDAARTELEEAAKDADFLAHAVKELEALAPEHGEDATLDAKRRLMQASERIRMDIGKANQAIGNDGAQGQAADALRWLEGVAENAEGRLDDAIATLARALGELADAERGLDDALRELAFNPLELEQAEERLFAIRGLARKHNVQPDELPALAEDFRSRFNAIEKGDAQIAALEAACKAAEADFVAQAGKLSAARKVAARKLDAAMAKELAQLKMERAVFTTQFAEAEAGPEGTDEVQFQVATNPGAPSGPLAKIASGGELSRFLLALKVCLTDSGGQTMIFDEIDRGVGGATADAVGRRLSQIAQNGQVLVVTHSPQVAAFGTHHWQVSKAIVKDETRTNVTSLTTSDRVNEIARMLAGENVSDAARSAAKVLLDG